MEVITGAVCILLAGNILGTAITIWNMAQQNQELTEIEQKTAEEDQTVVLEAEKEDGSSQKIQLTIPGLSYEKSEIKNWFQDGKDRLKEAILGENQSLDHVDSDLKLITGFPDIPVEISWGSSNPELLDWNGHLGESIPEEGAEITLYAAFSCQDEREDFELTVRVFPPKIPMVEKWEREAQDSFQQLNDDRKGGNIWYLPAEVEGESVVWSRPAVHTGLTVVMLSAALALVWIFGKKQEKQDRQKKRQDEMMVDYPEILNKFVLLLNAGMNTRKALTKVALDYRKQKQTGGGNFPARAAYEEIAAAYSEMEQGIPEAEAYEHLGNRCGLAVYKTFSTLLIQNLKKGNGEIIDMLEREAVDAFENRKRRAKILGEQAGTKLLVPMVLMLVIVFVILLFPAGSIL
ncbi:MAG: type II secretion system F family protein [Ruminococcus sp.]